MKDRLIFLLSLVIIACSYYIYSLNLNYLNDPKISQSVAFKAIQNSFISGCVSQRVNFIGKHKHSFDYCYKKSVIFLKEIKY